MSEEKNTVETEEVKREDVQAEAAEQTAAETAAEKTAEPEQPESAPAADPAELDQAKADLAAEKDKYLRLLAEYDNFRKRSQKEKDELYTVIRSETVGKFLPVYDNLERALNQETADEAYKKGVELTMNQLREALTKLGVEEIPSLDQPFDPAVHNAVMHVEDENYGENTVVEVFQKGFALGDKVIRFAMVKVAN